MSNIYLSEPPTTGKVLLHTSVGDIDIELWAKEAPLACRNFIQLSLEGYYDGTLFHRIISDFMAQGGDPTNSGKGGVSSWGRPFKDEIHGRIKFNHRGQLAMANENKPNTNQSQFFITLGDCEWLNRKHTIFGKVTGNTIFNVLRLSEVECGQDERPVEDVTLKSIEVLWNPFDDIIPRNVASQASRSGASSQHNGAQDKKKLRKGKKDLKLLSFGEEAELEQGEEEDLAASKKMMSAHDVTNSVDMCRGVVLSAEVEPGLENLTNDAKVVRGVQKSEVNKKSCHSKDVRDACDGVVAHDAPTNSSDDEVDARPVPPAAAAWGDVVAPPRHPDASAELDSIKRDILRSRRAVKVMTGLDAVQHRDDAALRDFVTPLERQRQRFIKRKREHGGREKETLTKLLQFSAKLKSQKDDFESERACVGNHQEERHRRGPCTETYHGQVMEQGNEDGEEATDGDDSWHVGKLKFRKHVDDEYRLRSREDERVEKRQQGQPSRSQSAAGPGSKEL